MKVTPAAGVRGVIKAWASWRKSGWDVLGSVRSVIAVAKAFSGLMTGESGSDSYSELSQ